MEEATIKLVNVNKHYGHGRGLVYALQDINFSAHPGELTLILGPSGSGKSTFLTIAGGLRQPSSGRVMLAGKDISKLNNKERDQLRLNRVGFVLQSYNLLPYLNVDEQFELVRKVKPNGNLTDDELTELLEELGIADLRSQYPDQLSGGQNQRVAIARALYTNPDIVLADEPTAALDSARVVVVGKELQRLADQRHKTVIVVTHDLRLKEHADRIYHINDGKLSREK
ncbi:ABC transporter ATP-binding protein [Limosilactobacillus secaliphilus]|uniref:Putative hemin import ATP-binding protein HrtA n=1 Tax=Limosilactobacillus secaliphilus TaxID=396268 RepID=A0A0R2I9F9_9LACO|nr:ABC transporter ATP-binding protein [Limosilactobacillus secaliphilus]KRN58538.1 lipoprotein releasing system, ATP-binding protein [Limosilactobacillus secaliphilus]